MISSSCLHAALCLAALLAAPGRVDAEKLAGIVGDYTANSIVKGLNQPDGIAVHPQTKEIYVAEKGAGRIDVIRNGAAVPVLESNWTVDDQPPNWVVGLFLSREEWLKNQLNNPGAITISTNGHLFVTEDVPAGRILEFIPDEKGQWTKAKLIPVPWLEKKYAWSDIKVTDDGRLFIAGADKSVEVGAKFGTVMMRDPEGDWWVIDFGPFADFSGIYYSRYQDIVVVAERARGGLTWWDAYRHLPIGIAGDITAESEAESVALLPDGAFVVAQKATAKGNDARLLRIDPINGQISEIAGGFPSLSYVILSPDTGNLLATDGKSGMLVECAPKTPIPETGYLLQRSQDGYEMKKGFTPKNAPAFLANFFSKVAVSLKTGEQAKKKGVDRASSAMAIQFSLRDFAAKIPLVAGRIKMLDVDSVHVKDPVTMIDFVLIFPGRAVISGNLATPSLCFFSAKKKSGKVDQTQLLFDKYTVNQKQKEGDWEEKGTGASLFVPLASCGLKKEEDGMAVNLVFLGLGVFDDYYLNLTSGKQNQGKLIVEGLDGTRTTYDTSFMDVVKTENNELTEVKNLVVAGFDPMEKSNIGWLQIGRLPPGTAVGVGDVPVQRFSSVDEGLMQMIEKKEMQWRTTAEGVAPMSPEEETIVREAGQPTTDSEGVTNEEAEVGIEATTNQVISSDSNRVNAGTAP